MIRPLRSLKTGVPARPHPFKEAHLRRHDLNAGGVHAVEGQGLVLDPVRGRGIGGDKHFESARDESHGRLEHADMGLNPGDHELAPVERDETRRKTGIGGAGEMGLGRFGPFRDQRVEPRDGRSQTLGILFGDDQPYIQRVGSPLENGAVFDRRLDISHGGQQFFLHIDQDEGRFSRFDQPAGHSALHGIFMISSLHIA